MSTDGPAGGCASEHPDTRPTAHTARTAETRRRCLVVKARSCSRSDRCIACSARIRAQTDTVRASRMSERSAPRMGTSHRGSAVQGTQPRADTRCSGRDRIPRRNHNDRSRCRFPSDSRRRSRRRPIAVRRHREPDQDRRPLQNRRQRSCDCRCTQLTSARPTRERAQTHSVERAFLPPVVKRGNPLA